MSTRSAFLRSAVVLAVAGLAACKTSQAYMWVDSVPKSMISPDSTYQIAAGDVIGVRVFNQEANSVERIRVREDGKISLPLLKEVEVAGWEPSELARHLEAKLKTYITAPVVTIVIHERNPVRVSVLGKVGRPGVYDLERRSGVLSAIAAAGGPTPFASDDGVYVLRSGYWADGDPAPARIRFRYRDLMQGKVPGALFVLRGGDVVVVE